ncbi:MAG: hypothetical protein JW854_09055 [Actinobacteria bacterium]|nr:hypothetical protein [Actinomycetota bacterium]
MARKEDIEVAKGGIIKKIRPLILLALVAGLAFKYTQLDESKKRFIMHLAKQAPYLPGRYYA